MSNLKGHIFDWLMELEEEKAANFLNDCEVNETYIDTLFTMDSDAESYLYKVTVNIPLKTYRKIEDYTQEVSAIESAITESGQANGIYVRRINWSPYLKNEHKKQADKKANEIT